jgi:hypothetical protein
MELQALRYAAMVSTMTADQLVAVYSQANDLAADDARQIIEEWVAGPFEELPDQVRIVLVSADFSTEITSTVIWLNDTYNLDISCYRIVSYRLADEVLLDLQQIIPLPEAKDFQIQQRQKGAATAAARSQGGRDYTRYDVNVGDQERHNLSKQAAVKFAIQKLHHAGVDLAQIQSATWANRWIVVHPEVDESTEEAFRREYPDRSPTNMWFDLGITEGGVTWVIPTFGGTATEQALQRLAVIATPHTALRWTPSNRTTDQER